MKKILGLDLGTNSIGWAIVNAEENNEGQFQELGIEAAGSRIIPMDAATLGDFDKGNSFSATKERTRLRGIRRLRERHLLRRERLHRILELLGFLPPHYARYLDRYGKITNNNEPKLAWIKKDGGKSEFLFTETFNKMLDEFKTENSSINKKIPYDWTIYYLRKKALQEKISKEELAWILLNFNQKRGYYQLRGEEETEKNKKVEYHALRVTDVKDSGEKRGKETWYNVHLENGWIYRRSSSVYLDWVGKTKEFIVTTELNSDGTPKRDKDGNEKRSFRSPKEDDWTLVKEKTQADIEKSGKTVGTFIYDALLHNPTQKIRGRLVHTIERKYYKDELRQILEKQKEFHKELKDKALYKACVEELYPNNQAHANNISGKGFTHLFVDDTLFYQRPLKSKKSLIANCPYEEHIGIDPTTGEKRSYALKCIAKSHPLFQEFRLWQFINNLRIYRKGLHTDTDVTNEFLKSEEDYVALFEWLNTKKSIDQKALLKYLPFKLKKNADLYRWNYVEDKIYPCNETHSPILSYASSAGVAAEFFTYEKEEQLWNILYSIDNKQELTKALETYAERYELGNKFKETFIKFPTFKKEYGAYSAKAIKKLLPLMRMGKYWDAANIDKSTLLRIDNIITGECDDNISRRVREKSITLTETSSFKGLPLWLACYIVYNRHSESKESTKWHTPEDIEKYLSTFKQHSLRNPIVEQIITEALRTVRDIWKQAGKIDEIHIELGREMKTPADKRKKMTEQAAEKERTNLRIKALLREFANPEFEIENVRPHSPGQQDVLRIYEEGALSSVDKIDDDIEDIIKKFNESDSKKRPTRSDVLRYKLWLEQKYRSPYTGEAISLAKLFTPAYEIEHIIPQSRYFDDSLSNKVICESKVNKLKSNLLGYEFIKTHRGEKIELSSGKVVRIFTDEEYEDFVKRHYSGNMAKMKKLLMDEIPEDFIARQLNDSRYISKFIKSVLSNIVREEGEEEATSKNILVCSGSITDRLKKDWGINDVWNKIILPRFERLNEVKGTTSYTSQTANGHTIPAMPLEQQRGFNKKRIDHHHHAMDAIVIACATRNIINYLNNESASAKADISRHDLQRLICDKTKNNENGYKWRIKKPWQTFTQDTYETLKKIVVSFKQNQRIINKATNTYTHYENGKRVQAKQIKGENIAIRKSMHKDTVYGEINLRNKKTVRLNEAIKNIDRIVIKEFKHKLKQLISEGYNDKKIKEYLEKNKDIWHDINPNKIEVYYYTKETKERLYATRKPLDVSFDEKKIKEHVADSAIQKILLKHLASKENKPEVAFSPDGIDEMNSNIISLNNGKKHQPIYKVRVYEAANKFPVGESGNKRSKYVEAAKGTNLYYAIYETEKSNEITGKISKQRTYATIPLNTVIDRLKQGLPPVPANKEGIEPKYILSPNDLVYVPTDTEIESGIIDSFDYDRIYKMVSSNGNQCFFIKASVASPIIDKDEFSSQNKMERAITGEMIKEICIPIKVDRLGNILTNKGEI